MIILKRGDLAIEDTETGDSIDGRALRIGYMDPDKVVHARVVIPINAIDGPTFYDTELAGRIIGLLRDERRLRERMSM